MATTSDTIVEPMLDCRSCGEWFPDDGFYAATALGKFEDDPALLLRAAEYLERHRV